MHERYVQASDFFEQLPRFGFGKFWIARFDDEKESVVGRLCKALPVENRVIPFRQLIENEQRAAGLASVSAPAGWTGCKRSPSAAGKPAHRRS